MKQDIFEIIESSKLNLFTQNVCPKCMLIKSSLANADSLDKVNVVNLDEYPEVREWLKTNDASKNFAALPLLEQDGKFFANQTEIMSTVVNS